MAKKAPINKNTNNESDWADEETKATTAVAVVKTKVLSILDQALALKVTNNDEYLAAGEFLKTVKAMSADVDSAHDPVVKHWYAKHKDALAAKKVDQDPLDKAEAFTKALMVTYFREQERLRLLEENRLRKENEDRIRKQSEEENLKRAQELAEKGDMEGAAEAIDAPVDIPQVPIHVESTVPKIAGIAPKKTYAAEVVDLMLLLKAVVEGKAPIEVIEANQTFLNAQARPYKKEGQLYPGVMIVGKDSLAAGKE